jgi:hypothetical protein
MDDEERREEERINKLKQDAIVSQRPADFIPYEYDKWTPELVNDPMLYYKVFRIDVIDDP